MTFIFIWYLYSGCCSWPWTPEFADFASPTPWRNKCSPAAPSPAASTSDSDSSSDSWPSAAPSSSFAWSPRSLFAVFILIILYWKHWGSSSQSAHLGGPYQLYLPRHLDPTPAGPLFECSASRHRSLSSAALASRVLFELFGISQIAAPIAKSRSKTWFRCHSPPDSSCRTRGSESSAGPFSASSCSDCSLLARSGLCSSSAFRHSLGCRCVAALSDIWGSIILSSCTCYLGTIEINRWFTFNIYFILAGNHELKL